MGFFSNFLLWLTGPPLTFDNGQISDVHAWGTIWYEFNTEKISCPMTFNLVEGSQKQDSLTLEWTQDPCVPNPKGYSLSYSSKNGEFYSFFLSAIIDLISPLSDS